MAEGSKPTIKSISLSVAPSADALDNDRVAGSKIQRQAMDIASALSRLDNLSLGKLGVKFDGKDLNLSASRSVETALANDYNAQQEGALNLKFSVGKDSQTVSIPITPQAVDKLIEDLRKAGDAGVQKIEALGTNHGLPREKFKEQVSAAISDSLHASFPKAKPTGPSR